MNSAEKLPNSKRELLRVIIAMSQFIIAIEKWQQDVFLVKTLTDEARNNIKVYMYTLMNNMM